jgi:hypothetical protein
LRLLSHVVIDESNQQELRDIAYQAIFQIDDRPVADWPITNAAFGRFVFPDDIDWEFLEQCAKGQNGSLDA